MKTMLHHEQNLQTVVLLQIAFLLLAMRAKIRELMEQESGLVQITYGINVMLMIDVTL